MSDASRESAPPPKEDPETLVLRGSPRPVVRFRRGFIIGLTGAVAACLITLAWVALEPPSFRIAAGEDQGAEPLAKAAPEALADAPASYGDVPRLGPPLPGDLGRPILEHQRSLGQQAPAAAPPGGPSEADRARAAAEAERQRLEAAREAARTSGVIVQLAGRGQATAPTGADDQRGQQVQGELAAEPTAGASAPAGQARRAGFASSQPGDTNPYPLRPAPSPWTLSAGTIIRRAWSPGSTRTFRVR